MTTKYIIKEFKTGWCRFVVYLYNEEYDIWHYHSKWMTKRKAQRVIQKEIDRTTVVSETYYEA